MTEMLRPVAAPTSTEKVVGAARPEQSRARYPDDCGYVERDGVRIFYEVYGFGQPTVLLLPTWSIVHSRHWKMQIPYLARHCRVLTFDGRGNGGSDRPEFPRGASDMATVKTSDDEVRWYVVRADFPMDAWVRIRDRDDAEPPEIGATAVVMEVIGDSAAVSYAAPSA